MDAFGKAKEVTAFLPVEAVKPGPDGSCCLAEDKRTVHLLSQSVSWIRQSTSFTAERVIYYSVIRQQSDQCRKMMFGINPRHSNEAWKAVFSDLSQSFLRIGY